MLVDAYFVPGATEALLGAWQNEPSRARLNLKPGVFVLPQGAGLSLAGTF